MQLKQMCAQLKCILSMTGQAIRVHVIALPVYLLLCPLTLRFASYIEMLHTMSGWGQE